MSTSSSSGSSRESKRPCSKMTWHVEHASSPPHLRGAGRLGVRRAAGPPRGARARGRTREDARGLDLDVGRERGLQHGLALRAGHGEGFALEVDEGKVDRREAPRRVRRGARGGAGRSRGREGAPGQAPRGKHGHVEGAGGRVPRPPWGGRNLELEESSTAASATASARCRPHLDARASFLQSGAVLEPVVAAVLVFSGASRTPVDAPPPREPSEAMAAYGTYDGWEYPPPNMYSANHMDREGYLRVQGVLLKKGGSRRGSSSDAAGGVKSPPRGSGVGSFLFGRRNWSERHFSLDIDAGTWTYCSDAAMTKVAGVVTLIPGRTKVNVPDEVRLRGRHAPANTDEALNYFEVHPTLDGDGAERELPFAVRAPSAREFEEWIRALQYALAKARVRAAAPSTSAVDEAAAAMNAAFASLDTSSPRPTSSTPGSSPRSRASTEERDAGGFGQTDYLEMEYYYQDLEGEQRGPVGFDGLRAAMTNGTIDDVSYVYTNRSDEWIELSALPTLLRLLQPLSEPLSPPPPPKAEPRPREPKARTTAPAAAAKPAPAAFRL